MVKMLSFSVFLLCLWILFKNNKIFTHPIRLLFFLSLAVFVFISIFNTTSLSNTILILSVSSLMLAVSGFILDLLNTNRFSQIMMSAVAVVCAFYIEKTFHFADYSKININNYDPKGEVFLEIDQKLYPEVEKIIKNMDLDLKRGFFPDSEKITGLDDYFVVDLGQTTNVNSFILKMNKVKGVKWVEPNENIPFESPEKIIADNMPSLNSLSNDPSVVMQWHLAFLDMEKYYQYFKTNNIKPQRVAKLYILDTGMDGRHEDLPSVTGINTDKQGHGTHCAGVAAAITNNKIGVASMAPDRGWIDVKGIQVIGDVGFGTQKSIIDGIIKAADSGADVISMSLGGITNQEREKAYNDAIRYANVKGVIVVVAAGNANLDGRRYSPANAENVITVASVNEKTEKSGFSNSVQNLKMGISAPGERILSTTPSNTYTAYNGTSMATPQVAGLIAVMKAINPSLDTKTVYKIISETGSETQNTTRTGKLIQPYKVILSLTGK